MGGHGGAGGDGWGGREVEIPRIGKDHLSVARFSRRDPEDLKIVGRVVGLVREVVETWDAHAGWTIGEKPSHYLALRKDFTPVNGGYGPLPITGIIQESTEVVYEYEEGYRWVKEDEGYQTWHEHGSKYMAEEGKKAEAVEATVEAEVLSDKSLLAEIKGGAVLHIYGEAGTGKSVLARYLVQQLLQEASAALTAPTVSTPTVKAAKGLSLKNLKSSVSTMPISKLAQDKRTLTAATTRSTSPPSDPTVITTTVPTTNIRVTRPIILAFTPTPTHHLPTPPAPTASSTHHSADILATLISQYLIQDATSAHTLHRLRRAIVKRRKGERWWAGWCDEDMWLLFDEMLAAREERSVLIIIDDDFQYLRKQNPTGRPSNWVLQRLVDRVASGGAEGNGLVKLLITTRTHNEIIAYPDCKAVGYSYHAITLNMDPVLHTGCPQLLARNTSRMQNLARRLGKTWDGTLEQATQKLFVCKGTTWLDLQLVLTLATDCISKFAEWLESKHKQGAVDEENIDLGGWAVRRQLYQLHYYALINNLSGKRPLRRWAMLALGWLLYTPIPMRVGALAMAITIRDQPLAFEEKIRQEKEDNEERAGDAKPRHKERKKLSVSEEHPDFPEIFSFLCTVLGRSQLVHIVPEKGGLNTKAAEYTHTDGGFVGLRHGEVRRFLLGLHNHEGEQGRKNDDEEVVPLFPDEAAWSEFMALTCFKVMFMPGAESVKFPGEGVDNGDGLEIEPELDTYPEDGFYEFPGADEWGEKVLEGNGEGEQKKEEMETTEEQEVIKTQEREANEEQQKREEEDATVETEVEEEIMIVDDEGDEGKGEGEIVENVLEAANFVTGENTSATTNTPPQVNTASNVVEPREDAPASEITPPAVETFQTSHPGTRALLIYAILNWPIHAQAYYALTHPTRSEDNTPLPQTHLTTTITTFMTNRLEDLSWWRDHFSFLSRTSTSTTYPLCTKLSQNPLRLSAHFGLLPLLKHFSLSLPREQRTLRIQIMAMEAASANSHVESFKYLFHLHSEFEFPVTYFLVSAVRAIRSGALGVIRELLTGSCGERVKFLLCDTKEMYWGYTWLVKFSAQTGQTEIMDLLLDEMPETTYESCRFMALGKPKLAEVEAENPRDGKDAEIEVVDDSTHKSDAEEGSSENKDSPLHYACSSGFTASVDHLLRRNTPNFPPIDPSTDDSNGFTPLHHAVRKGHMGITKTLLTHPAVDVNTSDWAIKPLHLAAEKGYHSIVEELLRNNANPDTPDSENRSPLHKACIDGYVRVVQLLLVQGVDANLDDKAGFTPLHLAANRGNVKIVELLIHNGADPDATVTATGSTPLHYAAIKGFLDIVRKLLEAGSAVDPKLKDFEYTPLHLAAFYENVDVCRLLLEYGADATLITKPNSGLFWRAKNWNVLQLCWGNLSLTKIFIEAGVDINHLDEENNSPLVTCMTAEKYDSMKLLIDAGADVNNGRKKSAMGQPLYLAVKANQLDTVKLMLDLGADVNMVSAEDNWTPLYKATHDKSLEMVKLLCERGADVEKTALPVCTWRPLNSAACDGVNDLVGLLLHYKADPNAVTEDDFAMTPIYHAALGWHTEVVRTLLENGAKTSLPNREGYYEYTALTAAAQGGNIEIIKLLQQKGVNVDQISGGEDGFTALYMACANNHPDCAKLLLEEGKAAPDTFTVKQGWTALHAASMGGGTECVRLLLEHGGVNVNNLTKDSKSTAIWLAANSGHIDVVKLLLAHGADPCIISDDGKSSPLYTAASYGHSEIIQALLEHGGARDDINALHDDAGDRTALQVACENGYTEVVRKLLDHGADPTKRLDPPTTETRCCLNAAGVGGHIEIVKMLLAQDAQLKQINALSGPKMSTAVMAAVSHLDIVNLLLDNGADPAILNKDNESMLHYCIKFGEIETLKRLLSLKMPLDAVSSTGDTAVYSACQEGEKSVEILTLLLSAGASPLAIPHPDHSWSPLQYAACFGEMDIARLLLAQPGVVANIDYHSKPGTDTTALYQAAMSGKEDMIKLLIEHGASLDIQSTEPWTALTSAASGGHAGCVKLLLEHGADVHGLTTKTPTDSPLYQLITSTDTPLYRAACQDRLEICKLLLEYGADANGMTRPMESGPGMPTPLYGAASNGYTEICKLLLEHGASVDIPDSKERACTPLLCAVQEGYVETARTLIGHGAEVNGGECTEGTPLMFAARRGLYDLCILLLEHGADVNGNSTSSTALIEAAEFGSKDVCMLLLERGADVNCNDVGSALGQAALGKHTEVCKLLLEHGANVNGKRGSTSPLALAAYAGSVELCKIFISHDADVAGLTDPSMQVLCPLAQAAAGGHLEICELFLEHGASSNINGKVTGSDDPFDLATPLSAAAGIGHVEICKLLLDHGANVNLMSASYQAPLYHAASGGYLECAQFLLEHAAADADGCVTSLKSPNGEDGLYTPLYKAAENGYEEMCKLLLKHGAHSDAKTIRSFNQDGKIQYSTPLYWAASHGNSELAESLLKHNADPTICNKDELGPLHIACKLGYIDVVRVLLAHSGVDPNIGDISCPPEKLPKRQAGLTPLYLATTNNHTECMKALLDVGVDPNSGVTEFRWNPLVEASYQGREEGLRLLIEAGGNVNYTSNSGHSLLVHASKAGCLSSVKYLIEKGAEIDGSDPRAVPFLAAISGPHTEIMKLLRNKGANIKARDSGLLNRSAFFFAAHAPSLSALNRDLIGEDMWDDINARDAKGRTPLFYAAAAGPKDAVQLLLERGADKTVKDNTGRGVLEVAITADDKLRKLLGADEALPVDDKELKNIKECTGYNARVNAIGTMELYICDECRKSTTVGYIWRKLPTKLSFFLGRIPLIIWLALTTRLLQMRR